MLLCFKPQAQACRHFKTSNHVILVGEISVTQYKPLLSRYYDFILHVSSLFGGVKSIYTPY